MNTENQCGKVSSNKPLTFSKWFQAYKEEYKTISTEICVQKYEDYLERNYPEYYKEYVEGEELMDSKTIYKIECEWDMCFNQGNEGLYNTEEARLKALEDINWQEVGYDNWQDVEEAGLLWLSEVEGN